MKAKMLGRKVPVGPGGRTCACCHIPPGHGRVQQRRSMKRAERQAWKQRGQVD